MLDVRRAGGVRLIPVSLSATSEVNRHILAGVDAERAPCLTALRDGDGGVADVADVGLAVPRGLVLQGDVDVGVVGMRNERRLIRLLAEQSVDVALGVVLVDGDGLRQGVIVGDDAVGERPSPCQQDVADVIAFATPAVQA